MNAGLLTHVDVTNVEACVRAARRKTVAPELLEKLADHSSVKVVSAVAGNPLTPTHVLHRIIVRNIQTVSSAFTVHHKSLIAAAISDNPNLDYDDLRLLVIKFTSKARVLVNIMKNPKMDAELLEYSMTMMDSILLQRPEVIHILQHPAFPVDKLISYSRKVSLDNALLIGADPRLTTERLQQFQDNNERGNAALWCGFGENLNAKGRFLESLVNSHSWVIRFAAVANPNLSEQQKERLRADSHPRVRLYAHLLCPEEGMESMPIEWVEAYTSLSYSVFDDDSEDDWRPTGQSLNFETVALNRAKKWIQGRNT